MSRSAQKGAHPMAYYRTLIEEGAYTGHDASASTRDILAAWLIALLLLIGAVVSVALDHLVTVSADPPATYSAVLESIAAEEALAADPAPSPAWQDDESR